MPVQSVNDKTGAVVLNASDVGALPADTPIPDAVTEQTVSEWGFTKNTGDYTKPSGGIPKNDLESVVQASLDKADTALQQHQSLTGYATETWVEAKGYQTASDVQTAIAGKVNAADIYTKTEVDQKLVGAMDYKGTKATVSELPTSGNATGDVWHITADGSEWAWNGSAWEELGTAVDLSGYRTASAQDTIDAVQDEAIAAKYTKPGGGIPKSDLASDVQTSLGKADTALQSHQSLSGYATEQWVENKGYLTQHQSLAAYRTASAQDTIDTAQNVEIAKKANIADLAAVATSGSYNDLTDKPTIPSLAGYATQAWVNNKGYLTLADLPVYNGGVT